MVRRVVYGAQGVARLAVCYKFMHFSHMTCIGEDTKLRMRDVVVNLPYLTPFPYSTVKV
jgi:hypothetical protein